MENTGKYSKYLIEATTKTYWDWDCMKGTFQDILYYDSRYHAEAPNVIACGLRYAAGTEGAGTFVKYPDHEEPDLPHAHACAEHFIYLGLDPEHPDDLGGTFDIWLGEGEEAESYTINKPTCVFMPPNTVHLPVLYKEVHKPFAVLVVLNSPMRALYLVDRIPPGFKADAKEIVSTPNPVPGRKKYAHCIIERDAQERDYYPSHRGKSHTVIRQDIRKYPAATNSIEVNLIYGPGIGWGCGDIIQYPLYRMPGLPHKHAWVENYCFVGTDPSHPWDLGGTLEFWIGEGEEAEQYLISRPTTILVPAHTAHLPMYVREVHNPFLAISVMNTPLAAEIPVEIFPPGFEHRAA